MDNKWAEMDTMEKFLLHSWVTKREQKRHCRKRKWVADTKCDTFVPRKYFSPSVLQCPPLITALVKIITANIYLGNVIVRPRHPIQHSSGVVHDIGIVVCSLLGSRG